jgi:hypothetical protein
MPTKQELEELPLDVLAVWCKRIADRPDQCTEAASAEAGKLRRQWFQLRGAPPRTSSIAEREELERQQAELKERIAEFLAGVLLS